LLKFVTDYLAESTCSSTVYCLSMSCVIASWAAVTLTVMF